MKDREIKRGFMDREEFKKVFLQELLFFSTIANRDFDTGFTANQVWKWFVSFTSSFYSSRVDLDVFATKKARFVSIYGYQIIEGKLREGLLDELCDEIEEEYKIRVK